MKREKREEEREEKMRGYKDPGDGVQGSLTDANRNSSMAWHRGEAIRLLSLMR
jgi:hypothetical protein